MQTTGWFNPCGVAYRLLSDGRVEIQGAGFPAYTDPSILRKIAQIWNDWGGTIMQAAKRYDMPPAWLVGIIYIESGGKANSTAPCEPVYCPAIWRTGGCASQGGSEQYCAGGLMAFTSGTARLFGKSIPYYLEHPHEQILDAAQLIAVGGPGGNVYHGGVRSKQGDMLSVAKMYNGGAACAGGGLTGHGGQGDYVTKFVKTCNAFVAMGLAPTKPAYSAGSGFLVFVAVAGCTALVASRL